MVQGNVKKEQDSKAKFVGFTSVSVASINPTRSKLNSLLGLDSKEEETEIDYLSTDKDGNERVRLSFWLHSSKLNKYFNYSFSITNKVRKSKDEIKTQYVSNVATTCWSDTRENLPDWFLNFTNKEKLSIGEKKIREALIGEEELCSLLRAWLDRLDYNDPSTSVFPDLSKLFKGDFSELQNLIGSNFESPFIVLLGVKTDDNDTSKQYQQVYGKSFLPNSFMSYINNGLKFTTEYSKKLWSKFVGDCEGEYGFKSYFELTPAKEYDPEEDPNVSGMNSVDVTPTNAGY